MFVVHLLFFYISTCFSYCSNSADNDLHNLFSIRLMNIMMSATIVFVYKYNHVKCKLVFVLLVQHITHIEILADTIV